MSLGLDPNQMTAEERLSEIAEILGQGVIRLRVRQSSALSAQLGESSVDFTAHQSSHAETLRRRHRAA
jgi:hypothetical protein